MGEFIKHLYLGKPCLPSSYVKASLGCWVLSGDSTVVTLFDLVDGCRATLSDVAHPRGLGIHMIYMIKIGTNPPVDQTADLDLSLFALAPCLAAVVFFVLFFFLNFSVI